MDFIKYNEQKFLESQAPVVEKLIDDGKKKLRAEWEAASGLLSDQLYAILVQLYKAYQPLRDEKLVGEPAYLYISYLRSGVLLHTPYYRIDLYDENGRISEVECSAGWESAPMREIARAGEETLAANFSRQSSAGMFCCEEMTLRLADELHRQCTALMPKILEALGARKQKIFPAILRVYMGEFLDEAQEIYVGRL